MDVVSFWFPGEYSPKWRPAKIGNAARSSSGVKRLLVRAGRVADGLP